MSIPNRAKPLGLVKLPFDAYLEWMGTDGSSDVRIPTDYFPNQNTGYQVKFRYEAGTREGRCGVDQTINNKRYLFLFSSSGGWIYPNYDFYPMVDSTNAYSSYGHYGGEACTWEFGLDIAGMKYYGWRINDNGTRGNYIEYPCTRSTNFPETWQLTIPWSFFACNNGYPVSSTYKFYYLKVFELDELIHEYVPVRVGNIGAIYDKATNKVFMGNSHHVRGPDKPKYLGGVSTGNNYHAEVEYLESTGTQYIDTGVIPDETTIWNMDFAFTTVDVNNGCGCSPRSGTGGGMTIRQRSGATMLYSKSDSVINRDTTIASDTGRHTMTMRADHAGIFLDGSWCDTINGTAAWRTTGNSETLKLFGFREVIGTTNEVFPAKMRIYSCSLSNADGPILELVPVRVSSIGYFYDRVTGRHFNTKNGMFALGPDKS